LQYKNMMLHLSHADKRGPILDQLERARHAGTADLRRFSHMKAVLDAAALEVYQKLKAPTMADSIGEMFSPRDQDLAYASAVSVETMRKALDGARVRMHKQPSYKQQTKAPSRPPLPEPNLLVFGGPQAPVVEPSSSSDADDSRGEQVQDMSSGTFASSFELSDSSDESGGSGAPPNGEVLPWPEDPPQGDVPPTATQMGGAREVVPPIPSRDPDGWHVPDTFNGQSETEPTYNEPMVHEDSELPSIPSSASLEALNRKREQAVGQMVSGAPPPRHPTDEFERALDEAGEPTDSVQEVAAPVEIEDTPAEQPEHSEWSQHDSKSEFNVQPVGPVYESESADSGSNNDKDEEAETEGPTTEVQSEERSFHDPDGSLEIACDPDSRDQSINYTSDPDGSIEQHVDKGGSIPPSLETPSGTSKKSVPTGDFDQMPAVSMPAIGTSIDDEEPGSDRT